MRKLNQVSLTLISRATRTGVRPPKWMLLFPVLALLLLDPGFGAQWPDPPSGQPPQMSSKVDYDPKLTDRFFDADEWFCKHGSTDPAKCRNGKRVKIVKDPCPPPRLEECFELKEWTCLDGCKKCAICSDGTRVVKSTAKCISTSFGDKHRVSFCEAKLTDSRTIDLFIHTEAGPYSDKLRIQITDGYFRSQVLAWVPDEAIPRFTHDMDNEAARADAGQQGVQEG